MVRVTLKFNNCPLLQKSFSSLYSNFILNLYIVYELNKWSCNYTNNLPLKNCLFGTVKVVKNEIRRFYLQIPRTSIWWREFTQLNEFTRDFSLFGVDNSLSSHADIRRSRFLVLVEGNWWYKW